MTGNVGKIGDKERDSAVEALGVHFAEGRLQLDDYERRTDQALYAETYDDLDRVFMDLPLPRYDSVIQPYQQAQAPTSTESRSKRTWTRTATPPAGKTRIWKRPFGMGKGTAIFIGWMITIAVIALFSIGFVSTVAITGSETVAVFGVFTLAGAALIAIAVMIINTILIATSYDPDAQGTFPDQEKDYPY